VGKKNSTGLRWLLESIQSVQRKIDDYIKDDEVIEITDKNKFVKRKAVEYLGIEIPRDRLAINHKGCIVLAKPVCPQCNSLEIYHNGTRSRSVKTVTGSKVTIKIQKYMCKHCKTTFEPPLDKFVKPYARLSNEILGFIVTLYRDCCISAREVIELCKELYGVNISENTVRRLSRKYSELSEDISGVESEPSDIYYFDEQRIKVNGVEYWRYAIIDSNKNVVCDEVHKDRRLETITEVMKKHLLNREVYCIVTDLDPKYDSAIAELKREKSRLAAGSIELKHQKCVFHLFKNVSQVLKTCAGLGPLSRKKLPEKYENLRKEIFGIFYSEDRATAWKRLERLYSKEDLPRKVMKLLENIADNFENLTHYMEDARIPMTNNIVEQYFREQRNRTL